MCLRARVCNVADAETIKTKQKTKNKKRKTKKRTKKKERKKEKKKNKKKKKKMICTCKLINTQ